MEWRGGVLKQVENSSIDITKHIPGELLQTILPLQLLSTKKSIQLPIQNGVYLIADLCLFYQLL